MIDFEWFDDFDIFDIGLAGAIGEELSDEERERLKIEQDLDFDPEDNQIP